MNSKHKITEFNPSAVNTMTSTQLAEMFQKEKIDGGIITPSLIVAPFVLAAD